MLKCWLPSLVVRLPKRVARVFLALAFLVSVGCATSPIKSAFNTQVALTGVYRVAAPLRADLCRPPSPELDAKTCESSLEALNVHWRLINTYNQILLACIATEEDELCGLVGDQRVQAIKAIAELNALIKSLRDAVN